MIEFFEFLNSCSPLRTIAYLMFISVITFIIFAGITEIIRRIRGDVNNNYYYYNTDEKEKEEE